VLAPPSFQLALAPHKATAEKLSELAGSRLRQVVCSPNGWLFDDRVKSEESVLAKLLFGPVKSLGVMEDLYAATVVVPTPREVPDAIEKIKEAFPESVEKRRRKGDASTFRYDDVHLIASLGSSGPGLSEGLRRRRFEIQVHTGLQFAWWRATHDVIYKGSDRSWRLARLASQIRASLELLDATLSDLRGAASLLTAVEEDDDADFKKALDWLERWPEDRRPANQRRFSEAVIELGSAAGLSVGDIEGVLRDDLVTDSATTPFQAVLGSIVAERGAQVLDGLKAPRYVLITEEFESACPAAAAIPETRRSFASPDE
jgi:ppGpp synthetase/RelA/SpoT-type nucleotidyltranferase